MSLKNLVGVSLDTVTSSPKTMARLLDGARRNLADARSAGVSAGTRFGAAYTAIRMIADAGLHAQGLRTLTSRPGHHQTAIQSLTKTFGVPADTVVVLDELRKLRNAAEYSGDSIPESAVVECIAEGDALLDFAMKWLRANTPDLID